MDTGCVLIGWSPVECWHTLVLLDDPVEVARSMVVLGDTKGRFKITRQFAVFCTMATQVIKELTKLLSGIVEFVDTWSSSLVKRAGEGGRRSWDRRRRRLPWGRRWCR
jgi:hypothetical protein